MENHDRERILSVIGVNNELRRLYDEHRELEGALSRLENRSFLTPEEELEEKALKKRKLQGVDKMMEILSKENAERSHEAVM